MGRNILFITTDQQRYEALGCNGGEIARTPVVDALSREGINYRRAHCNNPVCMPARTSMFTGQHPLTHGVNANGIPYNGADNTGVASWLKRKAGYRTALIGKSHFEPMLDLGLKYRQNQMAAENNTGPWLGFDYAELAIHGPLGSTHYSRWLHKNYPEYLSGFATPLTAQGGGETGAPEVCHNPIPRELYHTDWIADKTLKYLDTLSDDDDWFIWVSFPDPHHPFDPPASEFSRVNWRDVPLPPGHPGSDAKAREILAQKPEHWLNWYLGIYKNPEGGPATFVPKNFTHDQLREAIATIHVENELIDEACGRILSRVTEKGWMNDTDIFFTTDHGDLQGDFGLMFKGPYHVDSLLHIPFIYKPAASAGISATEVSAPVTHVDLFPTFCDIAGVPVPGWVQGESLPLTADETRERAITTWDSQYRRVGMHLRTIYRDGYTLTSYLPSTRDKGGRFPILEAAWGDMGKIPKYKGTEGELYDHKNDPLQWRNLWDDPAYASIKSDLLADLLDNIPPERTPPLKVVVPV